MLYNCTAWIFDLDGTLTESLHDFPAISRALGLPADEPILEALAKLPAAEAADIHHQLNDIEMAIAEQATPQPGAYNLLNDLRAQGKQVGILTRNTKAIAHKTLAACGLAEFFHPDWILGRSCCAPKPRPDGIQHLLAIWSIAHAQAVMIGDHKFDLVAGRNAKVLSIYLDPSGKFPWKQYADYSVQSLEKLRQLAVLPSV